MMNKVYSSIGLAILFIFIGSFAPKAAFAQMNPGDSGAPFYMQGPQNYGNPTYQYASSGPVIYNPSNEPAYSAPLPRIDYYQTPYPGPAAHPVLPTIYGQNGQYGTTTSSSTVIAENDGSVFGSLFGNKNKTFDSANSQASPNLQEMVNTKGLALGTTSGSLCEKDSVEYLVLYKNITKEVHSNVAIRVYLPDNVDFVRTSAGNYSKYDHSVTVFFGTLTPGTSGEFTISGHVTSTENSSVARAEMVYTKTNGAQDIIVAYAFQGNDACDSSRLAGFAAGSGFLPTTLVGWIILSIIACAVIYFIRFFKKKKEEEAHHVHPVHAH